MTKAKVLIVEDETIIALEMKRTLERMNFEVTNMATNYNTALNSIRIKKPDIIIMDINLKNSKDGIDTAKKIQTISEIPIIYITAFSDEETVIRAIETNPVSYLTKPFKRDELKSNILLGLYKSKNNNKSIEKPDNLHLGLGYYYDTDSNKLFYNEIPIKLSAKETNLLRLLIDAKGSIVTFEELEQELWNSNSVSESALRTLVYRLRSKLEHKLIETVPMVGCKLLCKE